MRVHFIVHESFEAPGAYETWAINQGHDVTYSRVYAGDRLPDDAVGIDFLIVMGGPQDPDTTLEACPHFNAKAEQALIAFAVKTGKAVIGICLGSGSLVKRWARRSLIARKKRLVNSRSH